VRFIPVSRILIVGANSFDSGKTHLALQLGKTFIDARISVGYFKPISGHNYWYNFEHTRTCLEKQQLVSKDATRIRDVLGLKSEIMLMNPIHSLFVPARIGRPLQQVTNSLGFSGSTSILTMQRFSKPMNHTIDSTVLIADELLEENRLIIELDEVGRLSHNTSILDCNSLEEFQEFERLHYEEYVSQSFSKIERGNDKVIIESFNDSVWPWEGLESVHNVLVVSPGHVFAYDPDKFRKAAYLMKRGDLPIREVTFGRIADLLKPISKLEIRPDSNLTCDQLERLNIVCHTGKKD
jgi:predicted P-loop ATPase/GTPase